MCLNHGDRGYINVRCGFTGVHTDPRVELPRLGVANPSTSSGE